MTARILCTAAALLLALGGFFGASPMPANPLNLFGVLFLVLSGAIWFGWQAIRDAYAGSQELGQAVGRVARGHTEPMFVRLGPFRIHRLIRKGTE